MRKFLLSFISAFAVPYVMLASAVIVIDPYYVFHQPLFHMKPIQTDQAHYTARGLIRNMDYSILICGTSMCENMHTDYADSVWKGTSIKVIQHGSYSMDFAASLKQAAAAGSASAVIMGLDTTMWKKPSDSYRISGIPKYAVEKPGLLDSIPYIFHAGNLKLCVDLVMENRNGSVIPMNDWWTIEDTAYSKTNLAEDWAAQLKNGYGLPGIDAELAMENYENIKIGVEACMDKDIKIKFFIPPYSAADFSLYDYKKDFKIVKEIWKKLLGYQNVEIYAVQFDTDLIQHFDWYRNTSHYNGLVCDRIISDIAQGRFKLTAGNLDDEVQQFVNFLDHYDFNGTYSRLSAGR